MSNFLKAAIGCAAAVLLMASCGRVVVDEQPVEGTKESSAIEYRSYCPNCGAKMDDDK